MLGLGTRPGLRALRLKLLYDLWLREDRVYAHLHKAIEEEHSGVEYEVARARDVVQQCRELILDAIESTEFKCFQFSMQGVPSTQRPGFC